MLRANFRRAMVMVSFGYCALVSTPCLAQTITLPNDRTSHEVRARALFGAWANSDSDTDNMNAGSTTLLYKSVNLMVSASDAPNAIAGGTFAGDATVADDGNMGKAEITGIIDTAAAAAYPHGSMVSLDLWYLPHWASVSYTVNAHPVHTTAGTANNSATAAFTLRIKLDGDHNTIDHCIVNAPVID